MAGIDDLTPDEIAFLRSAFAQKQAANQSVDTARAAARAVAPGLMDYFTQQRPPPSMMPNAAGKLPSSDDPYLGPALADAATIGLSAVPAGAALRAAPMVAEAAGRIAPSAARGLSSVLDVGTAAGGLGAALSPDSANAGNKVALRSPASDPGPAPTAAVPMPQAAAGSMRPQFTGEERDRLVQIEKDITTLGHQKQDAINSVGRSRIASTAQTYDDQIKAKQDEATKMRTDMLNKQSAFDMATQPISVRNSDAVAAARAAAMGGSLVTGALHGLTHRPGIAPWLLSAGLGGLEGAAGVVGPNLYDLGAPQGTQAREAAERNLRFISHPTEPGAWDYARNVIAPEAAGGSSLGVIGHGAGHALSGATNALVRGAQSMFGAASAPAVAEAALKPAAAEATVASASGKAWPKSMRPDQVGYRKDGLPYELATGHPLPKNLADALTTQKSRKPFGSFAP